MSVSLGRLQPVAPRDVWPHEATDFTPWLLANVDVLSDLLGMDLALEAAEHPVGSFSLDLIGRDEATGERVIVENQLEFSDHTHLGQIITYAAGTDPTTIVWITTGFRPEHRAAIDWLNERTDEHTRFFGVVIHTVRIGDSPVAPNFELVASPNDWEKVVRRAAAGAVEDSARSAQYRAFWEQFLEHIRPNYPSWTRARTSGQNWADTSTGIPNLVVSMAFRRDDGLVAQLYFNHSDAAVNESRFDALYERRGEFERIAGAGAEWDRMEGRKAARIAYRSPFNDPTNTQEWTQMNAWLVERQVALRTALTELGAAQLFANRVEEVR